MRSRPFLLLFGVPKTGKNEFGECASTLNFEISIYLLSIFLRD